MGSREEQLSAIALLVVAQGVDGSLAGLGAGLFASLEDAATAMRGPVRRFDPAMDAAERAERLARWRKALAMT